MEARIRVYVALIETRRCCAATDLGRPKFRLGKSPTDSVCRLAAGDAVARRGLLNLNLWTYSQSHSTDLAVKDDLLTRPRIQSTDTKSMGCFMLWETTIQLTAGS